MSEITGLKFAILCLGTIINNGGKSKALVAVNMQYSYHKRSLTCFVMDWNMDSKSL